jgi:hypothetical protein
MFAPTQSKSAAAPTIRPTTPFFQPKLTVNTPGDAYEQEADRVADQVMRMKAPLPSPQGGETVQRMPITPLSVQRKCADCEKEEKTMRKETGGGDASGKAAPAAVSEVLSSGGGQPLDSSTRQWAESRFGQDFSQVRVHTDARAADSVAAIQARAYTSGRNVVFGAGEYQPQSESGQRLLAHELVHVGQQGKGNSPLVKRVVGDNNSVRTAGVTPPRSLMFYLKAFIPQTVAGLTQTVPAGPHTGKTMIPGPGPISDCYLTDNRGFSDEQSAKSRINHFMIVNLDSLAVTSDIAYCNQTTEIDCEDGTEDCALMGDASACNASRRSHVGNYAQFIMSGSANNPCFPGSPAIDYYAVIGIDKESRHIGFNILLDSFPSFEMYVKVLPEGATLNLFRSSPPEGNSPANLFGAYDSSRSQRGNITF